jgi:hypothetical protein
MTMLEIMQDRWHGAKFLRNMERDPVLGPALAHARARLADNSQPIAQALSRSEKQLLLVRLFIEARRCTTSENVSQSVRQRLTGHINVKSRFDVMLMTPPAPFVGISGALGWRIEDVVRTDKILRRYFEESYPTPRGREAFLALARKKHHELNLVIEVYHQIRLALGIVSDGDENDWRFPVYVSSCLFWERRFLYNIGLAMPDERREDWDFARQIADWTFYVAIKDPTRDFVWDDTWRGLLRGPFTLAFLDPAWVAEQAKSFTRPGDLIPPPVGPWPPFKPRPVRVLSWLAGL